MKNFLSVKVVLIFSILGLNSIVFAAKKPRVFFHEYSRNLKQTVEHALLVIEKQGGTDALFSYFFNRFKGLVAKPSQGEGAWKIVEPYFNQKEVDVLLKLFYTLADQGNGEFIFRFSDQLKNKKLFTYEQEAWRQSFSMLLFFSQQLLTVLNQICVCSPNVQEKLKNCHFIHNDYWKNHEEMCERYSQQLELLSEIEKKEILKECLLEQIQYHLMDIAFHKRIDLFVCFTEQMLKQKKPFIMDSEVIAQLCPGMKELCTKYFHIFVACSTIKSFFAWHCSSKSAASAYNHRVAPLQVLSDSKDFVNDLVLRLSSVLKTNIDKEDLMCILVSVIFKDTILIFKDAVIDAIEGK